MLNGVCFGPTCSVTVDIKSAELALHNDLCVSSDWQHPLHGQHTEVPQLAFLSTCMAAGDW